MHILLLCLLFQKVFFLNPLHASLPSSAVMAKELLPLYENFHAHPELSFQEKQTAARFALELRKSGYETVENFGGYGVVGLLKNGPGKTLMLRADLDALPVTEQSGLSYASTVRQKNANGVEVGVMHACGHDLHMTNMIGVARTLSQNRAQWSGTLLVIGQPAEEKGFGAKAMLEKGLYRQFPKPDFALALHVEPSLPAGTIALKAGYIMANVDTVDITLYGKGGHGARPHETIDPIIMASQLVLDLQTLISREKAPTDPAVITVGALHAGSKHNIISDRAELQLTIRSLTPETRTKLLEGIARKAKAVAASMNAPEPKIHMTEEPVPALSNDKDLVNQLRPLLENALGKDQVLPGELAMIGEDFSRYSSGKVPIALFSLGSIKSDRLDKLRKQNAVPSLHSGTFYPDAELTLATGIQAMTAAAVGLLAKGQSKLH